MDGCTSTEATCTLNVRTPHTTRTLPPRTRTRTHACTSDTTHHTNTDTIKYNQTHTHALIHSLSTARQTHDPNSRRAHKTRTGRKFYIHTYTSSFAHTHTHLLSIDDRHATHLRVVLHDVARAEESVGVKVAAGLQFVQAGSYESQRCSPQQSSEVEEVEQLRTWSLLHRWVRHGRASALKSTGLPSFVLFLRPISPFLSSTLTSFAEAYRLIPVAGIQWDSRVFPYWTPLLLALLTLLRPGAVWHHHQQPTTRDDEEDEKEEQENDRGSTMVPRTRAPHLLLVPVVPRHDFSRFNPQQPSRKGLVLRADRTTQHRRGVRSKE